MKILFTADWQAAWHNLDKCGEIFTHIWRVCQSEHIRYAVLNGDSKDQYNPMDVRVANFMVDAISRQTRAGLTWLFNLGNHDRTGMHDASDNWFPILRSAGAVTFDAPSVYEIPDSDIRLRFLPYMSDVFELQRAAKKLARGADPKRDILAFHNELRKCRVNNVAKYTGNAISVEDLQPSRYMFCLGGHIHLRQKMAANVHFIGSPFATDWGEANQVKGCYILDTKRRKLRFTPSPVPGMYDPTWPGFAEAKPESWEGALVRTHVSCDRSLTNLQQFLDKARQHDEKKYPGAVVIVKPEFLDEAPSDGYVPEGSTDADIIRSYVQQHHPAQLSHEVREVVSYLLHKLSAVGAVRRAAHQVKLLSCQADNFLSFKKLLIDYKQLSGITLITGRNLDWPNRNNGAGKTSWLQPPLVAMFGRTLKKQAHDSWARNRVKHPAVVSLKMKLSDGRICRITRQRRPTRLRLHVNGKDVSNGIGVDGTQKAFEALTGLTFDMLSNAMYIDQSAISRVLSGTDAERKAIFSQFLNLERFAKAREAMKDDLAAAVQQYNEIQGEHTDLIQRCDMIRTWLHELPSGSVKRERRKWQHAKAELAKLHEAMVTLQREVVKLSPKHSASKLARKRDDLIAEKARYDVESARASSEIEKLERLDGKARCPLCNSLLNASRIATRLSTLNSEIDALQGRKTRNKARLQELQSKLDSAEDVKAEAVEELHKLQRQRAELSDTVSDKRAAYLETKKAQRLRLKYRRQLSDYIKKAGQQGCYLRQLHDLRLFYEYCRQTFSKDGLPAYLAYQLCPRLNKASEHYSQLFSEGEIHTQFKLDGQGIDVSVINAHGGLTLNDQSQGETRMASIITGFAIADVMNPCDVLVLDEPGEGLDAYNAKIFANALREAAKRFSSVLVTTHNAHILGELSNERLVEVVKSNRVSVASVK